MCSGQSFPLYTILILISTFSSGQYFCSCSIVTSLRVLYIYLLLFVEKYEQLNQSCNVHNAALAYLPNDIVVIVHVHIYIVVPKIHTVDVFVFIVLLPALAMSRARCQSLLRPNQSLSELKSQVVRLVLFFLLLIDTQSACKNTNNFPSRLD